MGNVRLPKPTPLGWCVAAGIAIVAGTGAFLLLRSPIAAALVAIFGAVGFVLTGLRSSPPAEPVPQPGPARATVPAPRTESLPDAIAAPLPGVVPAAPMAAPVAMAAPATPTAAPASLPADPLDQVSMLSAYLHEETAGYQPSFAPQTPTLVARVPGQTLTVTEPDPLATAFVTPVEPTSDSNGTGPNDGTAWRIGMDILPQSRSSALAVGNRLGSFRSAVVKARREAKPVKAAKPKPPPGKHRAS